MKKKNLTKPKKSDKVKKGKLHDYRLSGEFDFVMRTSAPSEVLSSMRKALKTRGFTEKNFELRVERVDGLVKESTLGVIIE